MAHLSHPKAGFHDRRVSVRRASDMPDIRMLKLQEVLSLCAMSRSSIYDAIKHGEFPAPIYIRGRSTRWISQEIQDWLASRILHQRTKPEQQQ